MNLKEVESILNVRYEDHKYLKFRGWISYLLVKPILNRAIKLSGNGGSMLDGIDVYLNRLGIKMDSAFDRELSEISKDETNSFIFFGDHRSFIEPLLVLLSLPETIKKRSSLFVTKGESSLKLFASDTFLIFSSAFIKYIFPVVLRDSDSQFKYYDKNFVLNRRKNRTILSDKSIERSAEFVAKSGSSLVIFPQGYIRGDYWKSGMVRILDLIVRNKNANREKIYLVPFACRKLNPDPYKLLFRALLRQISKDELFVNYGKPISLSELMKNWNLDVNDLDGIKLQMREKIDEIKRSYYKWTENVERLGWK